jgi:hypothetical protein
VSKIRFSAVEQSESDRRLDIIGSARNLGGTIAPGPRAAPTESAQPFFLAIAIASGDGV